MKCGVFVYVLLVSISYIVKLIMRGLRNIVFYVFGRIGEVIIDEI